MFNSLSPTELKKVVLMSMRQIEIRLAERDITIELDAKAADFILDEAYEPLYGARPIRRYLEKELVTMLSRAMFTKEVPNHCHVVVSHDAVNDCLSLIATPNANGSDTEASMDYCD